MHTAQHINRMIAAVQGALTDDLRKPQYRGKENCLAGHCYVASESLFHMLGGKESGWVPQNVQHEGGPHWYLKHKHSGAIVDPTAKQFDTPVPYDKGVGKGFLTKQPSKRAQTVLNRIADGTSIAKNIGYVNYPKLGEPSPHTSVMESHGVPDRESLAGANAKVDTSRVNGAMVFNARPTQETQNHERVMRGFVNLDTVGALHAKRGHEEQHSIFARIKQKHGKAFADQLINKTLKILSPNERHLIEQINPNADSYKKAYRPEEIISHFHNYLQDPTFRQAVHDKLGLSPQAARDMHNIVKKTYQKVRLHAATLGPSLGKAETEPSQRVACSIAVFNSDGFLLMGQRNDSKKWSLPGGKANPGELPEVCARRELLEETGLEVKRLKFLGKGSGGLNSDWTIYSYEAHCDEKPDSDNDPDQECDEWEWIDTRLGLPDNLKGVLHNGNNDVTLQLLGLQPGSANSVKETGDELSKGLKHALLGAITGASLMASPAAADDKPAKWTPAGLHEDLMPIAQLESSGGKNVKHKPSSKGEYDTAVGAVGLKVSTAHDEYKHSKWLQKTFPKLDDPEKFTEEFKNNPALYNHTATSHWQRLKAMFGGDRARAAYAWRWGQGAATRDAPEVRAGDPYAIAYQKMFDKAQMDKIGRHLENPLGKGEAEGWLAKKEAPPPKQTIEFDHYSNKPDLKVIDPKFQGTGLAGTESRRPSRLPRTYVYHADTAPEPLIANNSRYKYRVALPANAKLYDLGDDEHGLMSPTTKETEHGTFYHPVDLDEVEHKIKRMGYRGYHNYNPQNPNAVALFTKVPVKAQS